MAIIKFTIKGNQEDPNGNPIPYFRQTQGSKWSKGAKRYQAWKGHVVAGFIDCISTMSKREKADIVGYINLIDKKPIRALPQKIHTDILIYFKNQKHADPDNIVKGINDALFMNDKYVAGSFDYQYSESGKVEVTIKL